MLVAIYLFPGLEYSFGKSSGVTKPYSDKLIEDEDSSRPKIKGIGKIYLKRRKNFQCRWR